MEILSITTKNTLNICLKQYSQIRHKTMIHNEIQFQKGKWYFKEEFGLSEIFEDLKA